MRRRPGWGPRGGDGAPASPEVVTGTHSPSAWHCPQASASDAAAEAARTPSCDQHSGHEVGSRGSELAGPGPEWARSPSGKALETPAKAQEPHATQFWGTRGLGGRVPEAASPVRLLASGSESRASGPPQTGDGVLARGARAWWEVATQETDCPRDPPRGLSHGVSICEKTAAGGAGPSTRQGHFGDPGAPTHCTSSLGSLRPSQGLRDTRAAQETPAPAGTPCDRSSAVPQLESARGFP